MHSANAFGHSDTLRGSTCGHSDSTFGDLEWFQPSPDTTCLGLPYMPTYIGVVVWGVQWGGIYYASPIGRVWEVDVSPIRSLRDIGLGDPWANGPGSSKSTEQVLSGGHLISGTLRSEPYLPLEET